MEDKDKRSLPQLVRQCGACTACCTTMAVEELAKPAGVQCPNLSPTGGCGIYEERPDGCRNWSCLWLQGYFESEMRPDRVGVVLDVISSEHAGEEIIFLAHEAFAGGYEKAMPFLHTLAAEDVVFMLKPDGYGKAMGAQSKIDSALEVFKNIQIGALRKPEE